MKFADILALAKAGYKPGEIKELLDLGEDKTPADAETPAAADQRDDTQPDPENAKEQSADAEPRSDDQIKTMQAKIDELEKKLQAAQRSNASKDISSNIPTPQSRQEQLNEIIRSYM